jgi:hypothetical protein
MQKVFLLVVVIFIGACGVPLDEHNAQIQTANLTIENLKATGVASKSRIKELEQISTEFDALIEQQATLVVQATRSVESYVAKNMGIRNDYDRELGKCSDVLEEAVGTLVAYEEYYSPIPTATPTATPTPKPYTIRPGIRPVGTGSGEVPPGLYKCVYSDGIYWARLARLGEDTILSNQFLTGSGETYVRIFPTDGAFELNRTTCVQQAE